ncbi:MAG TPA: hypothetical protein VM600_07040, partial [Actinomycetota bacterium]|nr:hypothetical protein [Actinomycetota bacterium]
MGVRTASDVDARIEAIEEAFVTHWSVFGKWSRGALREEDGVLWFETPIPYLPYNMVVRTRIPDTAEAEAVIDRVASGFRARSVPYLWVVRPTDRPADLDQRLARQGLDLVETATGMDLDLERWQAQAEPMSDATIVAVDHDPEGVRDYVELMRTYWSIPASGQELLDQFNGEFSGDRSPGIRLIAR